MPNEIKFAYMDSAVPMFYGGSEMNFEKQAKRLRFLLGCSLIFMTVTGIMSPFHICKLLDILVLLWLWRGERVLVARERWRALAQRASLMAFAVGDSNPFRFYNRLPNYHKHYFQFWRAPSSFLDEKTAFK